MKTIQTHAIINSIRSRQDKSLGFSAETPEYSDMEFTEFRKLQGLNVVLTIKPMDEDSELLEVEEKMDNKPPSQRLRGVIFRYWEQHKKERYPDFEIYYRAQMEKIIDQFKDKLSTKSI